MHSGDDAVDPHHAARVGRELLSVQSQSNVAHRGNGAHDEDIRPGWDGRVRPHGHFGEEEGGGGRNGHGKESDRADRPHLDRSSCSGKRRPLVRSRARLRATAMLSRPSKIPTP